MKKVTAITTAFIFSLTLAGCQTTKENTGQVMGGLLGGVLGAQVGGGKGRTAAIIAGTLLGAYIGGNVGRSMDEQDRRQAHNTLEHNKAYQPSSWKNPDSGNEYSVTPTRTYQTASGKNCRDYETVAVIDGKKETLHGTACRQPDGSWKAVN